MLPAEGNADDGDEEQDAQKEMAHGKPDAPDRNHSMFMNVLRQPDGWPVLRTSLPKGQRESDAILKIWRPKGIPIIVRQRVTPDKT